MPATSISSRQAILPPIDDPSVHVQIDKLARRYDDAGGLIMEMLASVGGGAQGLIDRLPGFVRKRLDRITLVALNRAFDAATQSRRYVRDRGDWFNRLASTVSGAAGGFGGLPGAMIEMPVTITMLLRGILDIAAEHGFDPDSEDTRMDALRVFAAAGPMAADDGTDLGLLRTRAEEQGDGTYKITGTKIFISSGEHDLTDNITLFGGIGGSRGETNRYFSVPTITNAFGAFSRMPAATERMILRLIERRSSRLMPGLRGTPAVTITTSEPAMSL